MSVNTDDGNKPNISVREEPDFKIRIRNKTVILPPYGASSPANAALYALLALDEPKVDEVLCQLKIILKDINGQTIFDYRKGGWVN